MITIEEIKKQEEILQFESFDNYVAYDIGLKIFEKAKERDLPVVICVSRCKQQLFYVTLPKTSVVNELWLKRKMNTVYTLQESSMILELQQAGVDISLCQIHGLPETEFAAAGGAFPVFVKGTGMVGVIAVSGLSSEADHGLIVETVKEYLNK